MTVRQDPLDDLLSPVGRSVGRPVLRLAERLQTISERRIGLLDNSKQNAATLLDRLEEMLRLDGAGAIMRFRKPSAAISAGEDIEAMVKGCDAVINAFGDCGSCTSWCVHDSVDIERNGIPVATINSLEFAPLGRFEAAALGMAELPIVAIPHPIGSLGRDAVRGIAEAAYPDIIAVLTRDESDARLDYRASLAKAQIALPEIVETDCGCAV